MSNKDFLNLGQVYTEMFGDLRRDLVKEGKLGLEDIGNAPLETQGGPANADGFQEPEIDAEKDQGDNEYNINNLSYTKSYIAADDEEDEEGDTHPIMTELNNLIRNSESIGMQLIDQPDLETILRGIRAKNWDALDEYIGGLMDGPDLASYKAHAEDFVGWLQKKYGTSKGDFDIHDEDEEILHETEKIARDGLNNFMKRKSVFDKLYDKVMVSENFGELEADDLDSLGLDDATPDSELGDEGEGDEITVTLDRTTAQALCDVLQAAMGDEEDGDEDEFGGGDVGVGGFDGEEDEEGEPTALNTSYNDGKNNKVGSVKAKGAASFKGTGTKVDTGSTHSGSYNDGKNNKVGNLKTNQSAFE
jgi:hypothetical protein